MMGEIDQQIKTNLPKVLKEAPYTAIILLLGGVVIGLLIGWWF